jgi:hypothetical protein
MKNGMSFAATLLLLTVTLLIGVPAWSDTITTKDHLSVSGSLVGMAGGVITLNARFSSGTKSLQFPIDSVQTIDFNSMTYNPGAPPKVLGVGPAQRRGTVPAEVIPEDMIVLRGDDRRACKLLSIDADRVYCDPKDNKSGSGSYGRSVVLRIQLGAK